MSIDKICQCVANMKFRKEIIIFSLILVFMLMSAVSAEENITVDDGVDSTSDYIELDSNQGYIENNVSENPILDDDVMDDDENISQEGIDQDTCPGILDGHGASKDYGFNGVAYAGASFNKNIAIHKSSSWSHYPKDDGSDARDDEYSIDGMLSNFQSLGDMGAEALNGVIDDVHAEDFFEDTYSSYREYLDSLENLFEENKIGDVFNSNIPIIDFATINHLKYDLISFMGAGAKYVDFPIMNLGDINAFLDIFDKLMNPPSTPDVMANIPSSNYNPMLRNYKYDSDYSNYSFYQDVDLIINSYDLDDEMELFMDADSNITDMLIIQDNMTLMNQTFDLNAIPDVCIDSDDMNSDLQLSDDAGCLSDAQDNSDKTVAIQSFKFSQQFNCLPSGISEDIQHTFYHMIGCESTNASFTKQLNNYDNLPKVSEFDTIASFEQEDNHDNVLFKKCNAPFVVENTSIFALFGVIEITIP